MRDTLKAIIGFYKGINHATVRAEAYDLMIKNHIDIKKTLLNNFKDYTKGINWGDKLSQQEEKLKNN